jgi:sorbitol-specific phosphotransferase system component IIC
MTLILEINMKYFLIAIVFALFTGIGSAVGSFFGAAMTGALIGFLIPCLWLAIMALFLMVGVSAIERLMNK